ncbi:hypothetical protein SAMN05519104_6109 [Rhizobiales bacterium GAS188]|nr:hypothetical protein SAMN05519104_6109 [Rhizobiales bacterium GAS188]
MSISGVGSGNASLIALYQQRRQDLQSLERAVKTGDIASARQALTSYQKDGQNIQSAQASASGELGGSPQAAQLSGDLAFMISSLQADPISSGQSTFGGYEANGSLSAAAPSQSTFMKDLNALLQAVQSGDTSGAQSAVATLLNDNPGLAAATRQGSADKQGNAQKTGLASMIGAVQAGDMASAQSALAALQKGGQSNGSGSNNPSQSGLVTDLASLIQAVQSGDMSAAQKALAALQGDTAAGHHHHHALTAASGTSDTSGTGSSTSSSDLLGYAVEETESQTLAIL